jgi:hypothetical protein
MYNTGCVLLLQSDLDSAFLHIPNLDKVRNFHFQIKNTLCFTYLKFFNTYRYLIILG